MSKFFATTSSFSVDDEMIPLKHVYTDASGDNISPHVMWGGDNNGAKSFAITCHDPDAPVENG